MHALLLLLGAWLIPTRVAVPIGQVQKAGPLPGAVTAPAEQLGNAFAAVATHVKPAVVSVYSERLARMRGQEQSWPFDGDFLRPSLQRRSPFGRQAPSPFDAPDEGVPMHGMGSGMILDEEGHILTNNHVVNDVDEIHVRLADGRQFEAEIVSTDVGTDVAVIRIRGSVPKDLPTVSLGDSDQLRVGDMVMAVGAPFGLTQTVTLGIISATGRSEVGISDFEDFLQTDAAINPGNSGGPLVNMRGEVVGMNSAIATSVGQYSGVGFAIPANMIHAMLPTLAKGASVTRGMLGVILQDVDADLAKEFQLPESKGVLVADVNRGSPADTAGLKVGDVIVRLDDKPVTDRHEFRNRIVGMSPGAKARLDVIRNGKAQTLTAEIGKLGGAAKQAVPAAAPPADPQDHWGLTVATLTPDIARQLDLDDEKGVFVESVRPGSAASRAGVQTGDVIVEADHRQVKTVGELSDLLSKSRERNRALLLLKRRGASLFVVVQDG
jgi:serine protease Do